jgi:hypothetical protein
LLVLVLVVVLVLVLVLPRRLLCTAGLTSHIWMKSLRFHGYHHYAMLMPMLGQRQVVC